ncbi:MAG: response regulator [Cyanobacteria bacterium SZAS LIN-2]|nr:response regulator [Cyanobacteria bacterium SZAS LIN-2]MBS2007576.1 response regulator [Cyanobacteria bacterium SZAS TMP-1]
MTAEPPIEKPPAESKLPARETYRILLMDSVEHTDELKAVCKEAGQVVVAAHSIEEAFAFLDGTNHADVVVCAAYLEDESMFEFLRRLKADPNHQTTKFMALALDTSQTASKLISSTEKAAWLLGVDAFVSMEKFDPERLIVEIEKILPPVPAVVMAQVNEGRQ